MTWPPQSPDLNPIEMVQGLDCGMQNDDSEMQRDDCEMKRYDCEMQRDDCEMQRDDCVMQRDDSEMQRDNCEMQRDDCEMQRDDCETLRCRETTVRCRETTVRCRETTVGREQNSNTVPTIKAEPKEVNQFLGGPTEEHLQLPPTPPSSHGSDSDGSQSPHSLPPSSPARMQSPHSLAPSSPAHLQSSHSLAPSSPTRHPARSSTAISSSPLLTAPHKLQGTSGPLMLTEEEKRTLMAEGYPIPNKLPLTKTEEKALKRVRRKIKNKISAQESRRKKKEYVECLEKKVENYTSENNELWKKVETLESANRSLLQQLQKLQALVSGKVPRSCKMASTQTGTCLMASVWLAVCLYAVRSRSLLFYEEGSSLENSHRSMLSVKRGEGEPHQYTKDLQETHKTTHTHISTYLNPAQEHKNHSDPPLLHQKQHYHNREHDPDGGAEYF
ncbi:cyclic AMP-responsive element-binding protein 3-like protein 1 isoform X1 [Silurus meridionalis]|nr:cyclic AMP-responsive element-binding protein 3-like protein 1 isoform X1 [Silurus meridionalis]